MSEQVKLTPTTIQAQPASRSAAVFLLPAGTGNTSSVEAIVSLSHGGEESFGTDGCGEFQLGQDAAKLIGTPPGNPGRRETVPMLT